MVLERYTTAALAEKDKVIVSNDTYALLEAMEHLNHTIKKMRVR